MMMIIIIIAMTTYTAQHVTVLNNMYISITTIIKPWYTQTNNIQFHEQSRPWQCNGTAVTSGTEGSTQIGCHIHGFPISTALEPKANHCCAGHTTWDIIDHKNNTAVYNLCIYNNFVQQASPMTSVHIFINKGRP